MAGVKGKSGAKKKAYDLKIVESLGALDCTYMEIASVLEVSERTIASRMEDGADGFLAAYKKGQGRSKVSLRRTLRRLADEGNIAAAIFLAKNRLGMTDYAVQVDLNFTIKTLASQLGLSEADFMQVSEKIARGELDFSKVIEIEEGENG